VSESPVEVAMSLTQKFIDKPPEFLGDYIIVVHDG
jgi:hypothetical protein